MGIDERKFQAMIQANTWQDVVRADQMVQINRQGTKMVVDRAVENSPFGHW